MQSKHVIPLVKLTCSHISVIHPFLSVLVFTNPVFQSPEDSLKRL